MDLQTIAQDQLQEQQEHAWVTQCGQEKMEYGRVTEFDEELCKAVSAATRVALREELTAALPPLFQEQILPRLLEALAIPPKPAGPTGPTARVPSRSPAPCRTMPGCYNRPRTTLSKDNIPPMSPAKDALWSLTSSCSPASMKAQENRSRLANPNLMSIGCVAQTLSASNSFAQKRASRSSAKTMPPLQLPGMMCGKENGAEETSVIRRELFDDKRTRQTRTSMKTHPTYFQRDILDDMLGTCSMNTIAMAADMAPDDEQGTPDGLELSAMVSEFAAEATNDISDKKQLSLPDPLISASSMSSPSGPSVIAVEEDSDSNKTLSGNAWKVAEHLQINQSTSAHPNNGSQVIQRSNVDFDSVITTTIGKNTDENEDSDAVELVRSHSSGSLLSMDCEEGKKSPEGSRSPDGKVSLHSSRRDSVTSTCSHAQFNKQFMAHSASIRTPGGLRSLKDIDKTPGGRDENTRNSVGRISILPEGCCEQVASVFDNCQPGIVKGVSGKIRTFTSGNSCATEVHRIPPSQEHRRNAVILSHAMVQNLEQPRVRFLSFNRLRGKLVHPDTLPRRCWDVVGFACLAMQLIYLPFQIAFLNNVDLKQTFFAAAEMLLVLIDFYWLLDIALNFITGFYNSMRVLETDGWAITVHYLKGWFIIDFLATLPRVVYQCSGYDKIWFFQLTFLIRVFRLAKLDKYVQELEAYLKSRYASSVIALGKLLLLPIVISHCTACALWGMGRKNLEWDPTARTWIKDGLQITEEINALAAISVRDRYICAMYFSMTVMSTVGLGDIAAELPNERGLLMMIMISTSIVVGVAVNGVSQFISRLGERTTEKNERLAKVARFMKWYQVPTELQSRVHAYLEQFFENKDREDVKHGLMEWIRKSDLLHAELNLALTGKCLVEHHLVAEIPRDLLAEICDFCEMVFHPPGDVLESPGCEVVRCLYIRTGTVYLSDGVPETIQQENLEKSRSLANQTTTSRTTNSFAFGDLEADGTELAQRLQDDVSIADLSRPGGILGPGSFLSDKGLFIGVIQTQRSAKCTSFCELISLDYMAFRQRMNERNPLLLHTLSIYALIELDSPNTLLSCLEEWEQHADETLLHGEVALHVCAKQNAAKCASLLISMDADVEVLDSDDKSAALLAAEMKHRDVFEVLVLNGALVNDEAVLPYSWLDVPVDGIDTIETPCHQLPTATSIFEIDRTKGGFESFRHYVEKHELKLDSHGHAGTKGLEDLFREIKNGECSLERGKHGRLKRRVFVVCLRLIAVIDNEIRALVEMEPAHWLKCSDTKLARLPSRRVTGGIVSQALEELITMRLGLTMEFYEDHMAELSRHTSVETKQSMTYPGLETEYVSVKITMRVRQCGMIEGAAIGLPRGTAFQRSEETEHLSTRSNVFFWPVVTRSCADFESVDGSSTIQPHQPVHTNPKSTKRHSFFSRLSRFKGSIRSA